MDHHHVEKLEHEIELAIARVFEGRLARELPIEPSEHTIHLMAKAAVTVFETAVENQVAFE